MRRAPIDFTGTAEDLARLFHETYRRVSPPFMVPGSSVPDWEGCRSWYRGLLVATFEELLFGEQVAAGPPDEQAKAEEREGENGVSEAGPQLDP